MVYETELGGTCVDSAVVLDALLWRSDGNFVRHRAHGRQGNKPEVLASHRRAESARFLRFFTLPSSLTRRLWLLALEVFKSS